MEKSKNMCKKKKKKTQKNCRYKMPQGILHLGKIAYVEHVNTKKVSKGPRLVNPIRLTTLTITSHTMLPLQRFNKAF